MSAFPQHRQSQREWLAYYATLKDDPGEGEDLLEDPLPGIGEESDEDPHEELDGLIDAGPAIEDDEAGHKQLDALLRAEEDKALQALAQRFEERAADYVDAEELEHESSSRRAKEAQAAARRARAREAESARRAEEEEEKARAEAITKRKHDALKALFDAYEVEGLNEPTAPIATAPLPAAAGSEDKSGAAGKKRFRIAKKTA